MKRGVTTVLIIGGIAAIYGWSFWSQGGGKIKLAMAQASRFLGGNNAGAGLSKTEGPMLPVAGKVSLRAVYKNKVAYVREVPKTEGNVYQIILKKGSDKEIVVEENQLGSKWQTLEFSPLGNYLMATGEREGNFFGRVYSGISGRVERDYLPGATKLGFTGAEKFFYACGSGGNDSMILMLAEIMPGFIERYREQKISPFERKVNCSYDAAKKKIVYNYFTIKGKLKEEAAKFEFSTELIY